MVEEDPSAAGNAEATRFDQLSRDEQDERREKAPPDILREALDAQTIEIATQLDALGSDARAQRTGPAGRLNRELAALTSTRTAVQLWEREADTRRGFGETPPTFKSYVSGLSGAAQDDRLPPRANLAILDAASWVDRGSYYRYVTETYKFRDDVAENEQRELAEELLEPARSRPRSKLEIVPDDTAKAEAERHAREIEARSGIERALLMQDVISLAEGKTYILTDLPGGFTHKAGDSPDKSKSGALRHINFNSRLLEAQNRVERHAPGWIRIPTETVAFTPVMTMDTSVKRTERVVRTGRFKTETQTEVQEVDVPGSKHSVEMINPKTNDTEDVVLFQYAFSDRGKTNPDRAGDKKLGYREFTGARGGNELVVSVELPASVATRLIQSIQDHPQFARDLVEGIVLARSNGSITRELWEDGSQQSGNPIRPPYEDLPSDWEITLAVAKDFAVDTTKTYNTGLRTFGDTATPYALQQRRIDESPEQPQELPIAA
ncbi:MAG TPA: hypothetical protein VMS08_02110 [Candidatus Saccharimonadia bacterium]|nr:hypothetical protein [Candidatus Saccharimonadia bacterium]